MTDFENRPDREPPPRVTHWRGKKIEDCSHAELLEAVQTLHDALDAYGLRAKHATTRTTDG